LSGARRLLRLYAPGAKRVEIMGEFTSWTPVSLQAKEGKGPEWTVALVIPAGVYRMNVRIDGGAWSVPIGVPAIADDFGPVGILRVGK
jgi:1,4-alpha-glucan branching enzyme